MTPESLHGILSRKRVNDLKEILRNHHLTISGKKEVLVSRLVSWAVQNKKLQELADESYGRVSSVGSMSYHEDPYDSLLLDFPVPLLSGYPQRHKDHGLAESSLREIVGKDYFYRFCRVLYPASFLSEGRDNVLHLDTSQVPELFNIDSSNPYKVLVYCTDLTVSEKKHTWPSSVSISVRGHRAQVIQQCPSGRHRIKALMERPCDITTMLHAPGTDPVKIEMPIAGYSSTSHQWVAGIFLCEELTSDAVIASLDHKPVAKCLETIKNIFSDDDEVICDDMTVKVIDPLTLSRIEIPGKSIHCTHVQCFDVRSFLEFERTAKNAKWDCLVCNKKINSLKEIVIDDWFDGILLDLKKSPEADAVQYFEDGRWEVKLEDKRKSKTKRDFEEAFQTFDSSPQIKRASVSPIPMYSSSSAPLDQNVTATIEPHVIVLDED